MIKISLLLNIAVLLPVCFGIYQNADWAMQSYGATTPARGILLAFYLTVLAASAILLFIDAPQYVVAVLGVQVLYKILTPLTVGDLSNPVVTSNLFIAAVHLVTLVLIFNSGILAAKGS